MSEYITVFIILSMFIGGWIAVCIHEGGVKDGLIMAIGLPTMIIVILAAFIWVGYSFHQVLGSF